MIQKGIYRRIGNGSKVRIWDDEWLPNGPPIIYQPSVVEELGIKMVVDLLLLEGGIERLWLNGFLIH